MTSVAVVILNYNGEQLLRQFLPSVIEHSGQAKVIVVDNGSTDSSVSIMRESFPQIELILHNKNLGYCGGYNAAISKIEADVVVLLNSDVEVTQNWLTSPIQLMESDSNIVAVQPKILSFQNKHQFEYAGAGGGFIDHMGYPFCRGRIFQTLENDQGQYNDQLKVFWASGACLIIRREKYLEAGGLDEDFFAHMEEIDLCWRLNRAGYSIFYDGQSTVYHVGGGTLSTGSPRKVFFNFKNGLSLLVKNLPGFELAYKLPFRILLDWVAAFQFLVTMSPLSSLAILKAHFFFFIGLLNDLSKRKEMSHLNYKVSQGLILSKLITIQYFIFKKKKFISLHFKSF
jgi:GT2 family glycosyltransferase